MLQLIKFMVLLIDHFLIQRIYKCNKAEIQKTKIKWDPKAHSLKYLFFTIFASPLNIEYRDS